MPLTDYPEWFLGKLLSGRKGNDDDLFCKASAFKDFPEPNITVEAPEIGPSESKLGKEHGAWGSGRIPEIKWTLSPTLDAAKVKEYLLVFEDPDAPLGHSNPHGIYAEVPASRSKIEQTDLELVRKEGERNIVKGGFTVGKNRRNIVYIPARPPLGHGPHRYFFEVVALNEPLSLRKGGEAPSIPELKTLVEGKVAGWGQWIGIFESTWDRHK